ncbi:MAG: helix-turn-helix domain-containing protein [Sphaerochaeta associata]|uniref:response regulator transcription factor n=1 Tax=Sphaerochaeta associata TaxID=1129264 RepID=UPI002B1EF875|nr:helix-turn-helix domain-containing protein [Sphaerochaeta associata]MEA5029355.1 helix-turn-helix domain-containing protein [Sphaerochaeta associata]
MRVMLIEDEPNAMERYSSYISSYDAAFDIVAKASTYEQARSLFIQTNPEIIFSDVVIPGNSGLHFLEEIRQRAWDGLAVIISGYGDFSYAQKAIKLSVFDYLLKPVFQKDLEQVLDKILRLMDAKEPEIHYFADRNLPSYLKKAVQYVEHYYNQEISLCAVAEFAHVSASYLSASFSKKCGMTFVEYLHAFRSDMAAKYLVETDLTLEEIADRVGFGDSSYLNRCFKKRFLLSPGQYRKQILCGQEDSHVQ